MPTKAELETQVADLEAQLGAKAGVIAAIRDEIGEVAAENHKLKAENKALIQQTAAAEKALADRTAVSTQEGTCVEIEATLVLAETEALTHWSNKASATWAVDFEGDSAACEWAAKAVATSRERLEALPDGSWRMHVANRNAAQRMESLGRSRVAAKVKEQGSPLNVKVEAVPTRSMRVAARDAARATGVGRFALGSFPTLSFLGPVQIYVRENGEVLIRPRP
jgi:regulator of replication initiation timing